MAGRVLVIGGGPGGIAAASAAASNGAEVTLITDGPLGGGWETLLAGKLLLQASRSTPRPSHSNDQLALQQCWTRHRAIVDTWRSRQHDALRDRQVRLVKGVARFETPCKLNVERADGHFVLEGDAIVVAVGATPIFPPSLTPDGVRVWAPHLIHKLPALPESIIVVGGGAPAAEYADAFSALNVAVTWLIAAEKDVLPFFPRAAVDYLLKRLQQRGVNLVSGYWVSSIRTLGDHVRVTTRESRLFEADHALVCLGHGPDFDRLNLEAAGLQPDSAGRFETDGYGRIAGTSHIYLVGDAARPISANTAMVQGRTAGLHAAGADCHPADRLPVVIPIYTRPAIAQVGLTSADKPEIHSCRIAYDHTLQAYLLGEEGWLELFYDEEKRVVGGFAVGMQAAQIVSQIALAVRSETTLHQLADVFVAHPTLSELIFMAGREAIGY